MIREVVFISIAIVIAGCGTVTRGTKQGVKFQSEPSGAAVTVVRSKKEKTRWSCVSPCELQLSRKRDFDVTFEKEGYKPAKGRLASRFGAKGGATAIPGNFVAGGGIGFIVDAGTGANMQLKPDPMRALLVAIDSPEKSVIYDVRTEGGGTEDMYTHDAGAANSTAYNASSADGLKRLPRHFGAKGTPINDKSAVSAQMEDVYGVQLTEVDPTGAAVRAGFKVGDVVQSINSNRISTMDDIDRSLAQLEAGESASVIIWRDGERYEASLEL